VLVLPSRRSASRARSPSQLVALAGFCVLALSLLWTALAVSSQPIQSSDPLDATPPVSTPASSGRSRVDSLRSERLHEPGDAPPPTSDVPSISGVVFDDAGQRIAGARIELRPRSSAGASLTLEVEGAPIVTSTSASNGVFSIRCADREGSYDMLVRAMECAPAVREGVFPGGHYEIYLSPASGEVYGTVADRVSGEPIAGACVGIRREDTFDVRRTLTDVDGRFAFRDLAGGAFTLVAANAEHRASTHAAHVRCGERRKVDVLLERTAAIEVTCVDELSGAPIEGVAIDIGHLQVRTDRWGRTRVPAAASPIEVVMAQVTKQGYADRVQRLETDSTGVCTVRLGPGATYAVRIEFAPGVRAFKPSCHFLVTTLGASRRLDAELSSLASGSWLATIGGVPQGALVEAIARAAGAASERSGASALSDSSPASIDTLPVLRLSPGASAHGVVVDPSGTPLDGVVIAIVEANDAQPTPRTFTEFIAAHRRAHTDARGRWTIPDLPIGAATLLAYVPGFELYERDIDLSGWSHDPVEVRLSRASGVAGPLEGVVRACGCACEATICAVNAYGQRWHTVSDGNGRFRFRELPAGEYALLGTFTREDGMRTHGSRELYRPGGPPVALDFELR
jgi:hypothetical protein